MAKRRGRSAAFMRSINPYLKKRKINKGGRLRLGMAKKRRSYFGRAKRYVRRYSRGMGVGVFGAILGAVGYLVFDALLKPFIPLNGTLLALGEVGIGFWLATSSKPWVKYIGLAAVFINLFLLAKTYVTPAIQGIIPGIVA